MTTRDVPGQGPAIQQPTTTVVAPTVTKNGCKFSLIGTVCNHKLKTVGIVAALVIAVVVGLALIGHFYKGSPWHNMMQNKIEPFFMSKIAPFFTHTMPSGLSKAWHATRKAIESNTKLDLPIWGITALAVGSFIVLGCGLRGSYLLGHKRGIAQSERERITPDSLQDEWEEVPGNTPSKTPNLEEK